MKAVIVECSNSAAVALCDDGTFRKVKNKNYSIGQELFLKKKKRSTSRTMQKLSICASLALFLLSFVGFESISYVRPYSYVSLDINPSIEYALNRYDKVISVAGVNNDGQQVVSSIESDVKNQNITTALGVTLKQLEKQHYISQEENNHVIISVCSNNDSKAAAIASRVDTFSAEESKICSIDTVTVSKETKDSADSLGITPGKLALIKAVEETSSDSNFDVTQWTDMSVSELETTIQQASNQSSDGSAAPAGNTVIDSEYLSSVLDDSTTDPSDSTATASATEADTEGSSTSTDKKPTNDAAGPSTVSGDSTAPSKPGSMSTDSGVAPAAATAPSNENGSASTSKPPAADGNPNSANSVSGNGSGTSGNDPSNSSKDPGNGNDATSKDPGNGSDATSKDPSGQDSTSKDNAGATGSGDTAQSPSKDPESGSSSKKPDADSSSGKADSDIMTEESSSKKDSYPATEPVPEEPVSDLDTDTAQADEPTTSPDADAAQADEPEASGTDPVPGEPEADSEAIK